MRESTLNEPRWSPQHPRNPLEPSLKAAHHPTAWAKTPKLSAGEETEQRPPLVFKGTQTKTHLFKHPLLWVIVWRFWGKVPRKKSQLLQPPGFSGGHSGEAAPAAAAPPEPGGRTREGSVSWSIGGESPRRPVHKRKGTLPPTNMATDRGSLQKEMNLPGTSPQVPG